MKMTLETTKIHNSEQKYPPCVCVCMYDRIVSLSDELIDPTPPNRRRVTTIQTYALYRFWSRISGSKFDIRYIKIQYTDRNKHNFKSNNTHMNSFGTEMGSQAVGGVTGGRAGVLYFYYYNYYYLWYDYIMIWW